MSTASRFLIVGASLLAAPPPGPVAARDRESLPASLERLLGQLPFSSRLRGSEVAPQAVPEAPVGGPTVDLQTLGDPVALERRLRRLLEVEPGKLALTVAGGRARLGDFSVGSSETFTGHLLVLRGQLDLFGRVTGNVVSLDGDIVMHSGATVDGDALALGGRIQDRGGVIRGEQRALGATREPVSAPRPAATLALLRAAGLTGVLLTLLVLGAGCVLFARPNLEIVSDTVSHSFLRSFFAGLLAQVLVIPTFGMLITGLVLSVVGVLLVPFVVVALPLLVLAAVVGGFIAVAHAMGETHLRRRMAAGVVVGSANSYRYLAIGLTGVGLVWLIWVAFGWVPIAGGLVFAVAAIATWLLATVGFGACLLSRAGVQPGFAGRYIPPEAMTDEYLWATPQFGVTAVKRPPPKQRGER
ncbi:MAG: hypothetical protein ACRENB_07790 [Gemmatimonadales bacterium]